jgi:shikimate dehydrogenase
MKSTYGIIGHPLNYSLSPVIHNTAFQELGIEAEYKLFPLEEKEFDNFFKSLKKEDSPIFGLNVTVPYKETVLKYMDTLSPFAGKVQAVNTIVVGPGRSLRGHNTDGPGFLAHLAELKVDVKNKRIAVLGAGGVARGIIAALELTPEIPESIKIFNRTPARAAGLIKSLSSRIKLQVTRVVDTINDLNLEITDILINCTSAGLNKNDGPLIPEHLLNPDLFVYDTIYNPAETRLLQSAKKQGSQTSNGLGMLYYQGILALEKWAGQEIPDEIKNKIRRELEKENT